MTIPEVIPIVNVRWDDILFLILATVMIGSALLVVILRDIIRCGLAMMVCFGALAGLMSAVKTSSVRNVALSATPLASALAVASRVRSGSISMPTPRAP